jgi:hypothetical protein
MYLWVQLRKQVDEVAHLLAQVIALVANVTSTDQQAEIDA